MTPVVTDQIPDGRSRTVLSIFEWQQKKNECISTNFPGCLSCQYSFSIFTVIPGYLIPHVQPKHATERACRSYHICQCNYSITENGTSQYAEIDGNHEHGTWEGGGQEGGAIIFEVSFLSLAHDQKVRLSLFGIIMTIVILDLEREIEGYSTHTRGGNNAIVR